MDEPVLILRSSRKTLALQIRRDGAIVVRAPARLPRAEIDRFLREKEAWLEKHLEQVRRKPEEGPFSPEELASLGKLAGEDLPQRLSRFAPLVGVDYGRVTIRCQHTRWGSCSAKGNLNFNCLLMLCPPEVRDYVVVHELCHRKQLNHSPAFWAEVARVMPEYKVHRAWLKDQGAALIRRLPS